MNHYVNILASWRLCEVLQDTSFVSKFAIVSLIPIPCTYSCSVGSDFVASTCLPRPTDGRNQTDEFSTDFAASVAISTRQTFLYVRFQISTDFLSVAASVAISTDCLSVKLLLTSTSEARQTILYFSKDFLSVATSNLIFTGLSVRPLPHLVRAKSDSGNWQCSCGRFKSSIELVDGSFS